jgi:hypothetical protein
VQWVWSTLWSSQISHTPQRPIMVWDDLACPRLPTQGCSERLRGESEGALTGVRRTDTRGGFTGAATATRKRRALELPHSDLAPNRLANAVGKAELAPGLSQPRIASYWKKPPIRTC